MNYMEIAASNGWTEILLETATLSVAIANRTGLSTESIHRFLVKRPTLLKRSPEALTDLYEMVWLIENPTPGLSREELKNKLLNFK